jgi:hypothetical protein
MVVQNVLLAAAISLRALVPSPPATAAGLYRVDLAGGQTVWSQDRPRDTGTALLFHRSPDGLLVSIKKTEVKKITATALQPEALRGLKPAKDLIVLGPTGAGSAAAAETAAPGATNPDLPGARKDGTALLNPNRQFKPEWDTKQVPGLNIPYPNAPNDYREGKTFAYPPAGASQEAPGDLPRMPAGNGELPRGPG